MKMESAPGSNESATTAVFRGGPLNGETRRIAEPTLQLLIEGTRYVLHFTDKHGVAHYYVPKGG